MCKAAGKFDCTFLLVLPIYPGSRCNLQEKTGDRSALSLGIPTAVRQDLRPTPAHTPRRKSRCWSPPGWKASGSMAAMRVSLKKLIKKSRRPLPSSKRSSA